MPNYAYVCDTCGPFEVRRVFEPAAAPQHCGRCQGPAQRVFTESSVPRSPAGLRRTLEGDALSAHEPSVVSAPVGRPMAHANGHSH